MSKIKKLVSVIILLLLSVFIFSACSNDIGSDNSGKTNSSQTEISSSTELSHLQSTENKNSLSDINSSIEKCENDILIFANGYLFRSDKQAAKIRESYGYAEEVYWLASYIEEQKQILEPSGIYETSFYEQLKELVNNDSDEKFIKATDYFTEDSTGFENLTNDDIVIKYYGDTNPIISKVKYINYHKDSQRPKTEWEQAFKNALKSQQINIYYQSPIIYRESWSYQHEDEIIEVVTASNFILPEELNEQEIEEAYNTDNIMRSDIEQSAYNITLLFYNNYKNFKIIDVEEYGYSSPSEDDNTSFTTGNYYSYFYDNHGVIKLFPIYEHPIMSPYNYLTTSSSYCFLDTDSNGIVEIVKTPRWYTNNAMITIYEYESGNIKYTGPLL